MQARSLQFSQGEIFLDLLLRNPQSENAFNITFISIKLPKFMYSQLQVDNEKTHHNIL